jgi:ParB family chromosome partitioning protein
MSQTRKALGMGLEQLLYSNGNEQMNFDDFEKEVVNSTPENEIKMIKVEDIRSNPYQPRIHFDQEALKELADSIKQHGVVEPIIVKKSIKGYELVAGERRTKAAKLAGVDKVPAIVKDFTDEEMMEIALLENIQRVDLTPIEEAKAYKNFIDKMGLTQDELANRFGKSRSYITNMLGLLGLPKQVQKYVMDGNISMSHARVLSKIDDDDLVVTLADRVINEELSVREIEKLSLSKDIPKKNPIKKAPVVLPTRHKVYENELREAIGNKVVVSKNKITIPFDSESDLDRIMEILNIEIGE